MANYLPNLPVKLKIARGKLEKYAREKIKIARGKSQKYAREAQQLPVANQQIKKFHGQKKVSRGKKKHCPSKHRLRKNRHGHKHRNTTSLQGVFFNVNHKFPVLTSCT